MRFISNATAAVLLHRIVIARFFIFTLISLGSSIQTGLAGATWGAIDTQGKLMIVVGIVVSFGNTLMAFLDQSMKRLESGESPLAAISVEHAQKIETNLIETKP